MIEEERKVAYITNMEQFRIQQGQSAFLINLLVSCFDQVSESYQRAVASAGEEKMDCWVRRIFTAKTLEDVFQESCST
jgi:hypothetical protein